MNQRLQPFYELSDGIFGNPVWQRGLLFQIQWMVRTNHSIYLLRYVFAFWRDFLNSRQLIIIRAGMICS